MTTTTLVPNDRATNRDFLALFNRLCVAMQAPADDSGVTVRTYWEALRDLPVVALERGATALMREPGRKWFPSTGEWRAAANEARQAALREAVTPVADDALRLWECEACQDTGFQFSLPCDGRGACGMSACVRHAKQGSPAHTYSTPCGCRASNRRYQERVMASVTKGKT